MALAPYPWLEEPAQTLLAMRDRMPNAVLLYGAPGAGLYELALAFSKSLFCLSPHSDGTPCGHCTGCRLAQAGTHPDFKQVLSEAQCARYDVAYEPAENERSDAKKKLSREIRIHQIRVLGDFLSLNANQGGRRVVLVHPADKLRAEAAASLLKSMEEPPEGLIWVLTAEKLDDVLPTIRSRSRLVRVPMPDHEAALAFLKSKKLKKPEEALAMAGGSPLAALEPSADDRLSAKTENAVLEFLRAGPELSVDALGAALCPRSHAPGFLAPRVALGARSDALGRLAFSRGTLSTKTPSLNAWPRTRMLSAQRGSARRRSRAAEQLTIRSILSRPLNRCCFAISRFFSEKKGCKTRSSSPILAE